MDLQIRQIFIVTYYHLLESKRNYQIILTNLALPILFFITSLIIENNSHMTTEELKNLIYLQFFSTSLLFGILTFSFSMPLQNNVEATEDGKNDMLQKTDLKQINYIMGDKLADLMLLNFQILFVLFLFSSLKSVSDLPVIKICILENLSFLSINPFAYLISTKIKTVKLANNIGVLITLILLFSLTFTKMFSTMTTLDFTALNRILTINPMFGFYDCLNNLLLGTKEFYFGSEIKNILYVLVYVIIVSFFEVYFSKKKGNWNYGR